MCEYKYSSWCSVPSSSSFSEKVERFPFNCIDIVTSFTHTSYTLTAIMSLHCKSPPSPQICVSTSISIEASLWHTQHPELGIFPSVVG